MLLIITRLVPETAFNVELVIVELVPEIILLVSVELRIAAFVVVLFETPEFVRDPPVIAELVELELFSEVFVRDPPVTVELLETAEFVIEAFKILLLFEMVALLSVPPFTVELPVMEELLAEVFRILLFEKVELFKVDVEIVEFVEVEFMSVELVIVEVATNEFCIKDKRTFELIKVELVAFVRLRVELVIPTVERLVFEIVDDPLMVVFTILDVPVIPRAVEDARLGKSDVKSVPFIVELVIETEEFVIIKGPMLDVREALPELSSAFTWK